MPRSGAAEIAGPSAKLHSIVPFNEPHVFNLLTYCGGVWPSTAENTNRPPSPPTCLSEWGMYGVAMKTMAEAHGAVYDKVRATEVRYHCMKIPAGASHYHRLGNDCRSLQTASRRNVAWRKALSR